MQWKVRWIFVCFLGNMDDGTAAGDSAERERASGVESVDSTKVSAPAALAKICAASDMKSSKTNTMPRL